MNAISPGGLTPDPETLSPKARAGDDHVRLTMDFDDDPATFTEPAAALGPSAAADAQTGRAKRNQPKPEAGTAMPPQLAGIEVRLSVEVGGLRLPLRELMQVEPGQLFPLDRMTAEPVSVLVNGKPFARGEIVAVGERFGVRLTEICGEA
ncbi:FliM/FliN family flagellar motor switch protein [Sandaracinobacteroides hominis]|uniref:FliM/FliN family flagellar motor switch protein n=1 Tax=Sandaracinobacteroides hominis TaxID=2780086 RepID=UPI0018F60C85|nr:FliM/FliN family flagellar motor switch protein [Sandaracinobacteroides hominis]